MKLSTKGRYAMVALADIALQSQDGLVTLAEISQRITDAGVSIRSLALLRISEDDNVVTIATSDNAKVRQLYKDQLVN